MGSHGRDRVRRAVRLGGIRGALGAILLVAPVTGAAPAHAQEQELEGLEEAVAYYHEHATSDLARIHEATKRLEAVAIRYPVGEDNPDGWLPAYWTAFAYTQLALFARDRRSRQYVLLADHYYDQAVAGKPDDKGPGMEADFHALNAMVLGFRASADPENADSLRAEAESAWSLTRETDPGNPMGTMNQGLNLIQADSTRVRAYQLLDRAIELYEPRMGSVRPNWGREFIDVWMGNYPRPDPEPSR